MNIQTVKKTRIHHDASHLDSQRMVQKRRSTPEASPPEASPPEASPPEASPSPTAVSCWPTSFTKQRLNALGCERGSITGFAVVSFAMVFALVAVFQLVIANHVQLSVTQAAEFAASLASQDDIAYAKSQTLQRIENAGWVIEPHIELESDGAFVTASVQAKMFSVFPGFGNTVISAQNRCAIETWVPDN